MRVEATEVLIVDGYCKISEWRSIRKERGGLKSKDPTIKT